MFNPFLIYLLAAFASVILPKRMFVYLSIITAITTLFSFLNTATSVQINYSLIALDLVFYKNNVFSQIFALPMIVFFSCALIFNSFRTKRIEYFAAYLSAACCYAIFYAGDFFTALIFLELLVIPSMMLVLANHFQSSKMAAFKYFMQHFVAGVFISAGIAVAIFYNQPIGLQNFIFSNYNDTKNLGHLLILLGLLINFAAPPFSSWLTGAYPKASFQGTAYLSLFSTKATAFLLLENFAGNEILIYPAILMMVYGFSKACFCSNLRKIICYLIMTQLGFLLAIASSIKQVEVFYFINLSNLTYIALALFILSLINIDDSKMRKIGLENFKKNKALSVVYVVFLLALIGLPFTNGFIYKSLIINSDLPILGNISFVNMVFVLSVVGLRLPYKLFKDEINIDKRLTYYKLFAIAVVVLLCFLPAIFTEYSMKLVGIEGRAITREYSLMQEYALAILCSVIIFVGLKMVVFSKGYNIPESDNAYQYLRKINNNFFDFFDGMFRFLGVLIHNGVVFFNNEVLIRINTHHFTKINSSMFFMMVSLLLSLIIFSFYIG